MGTRRAACVLGISIWAACVSAQKSSITKAIDSYIEPYVASSNFSGVVLVEKNGKVLHHKAYGFADREKQVRNTTSTLFHIASVSMQFTSAAILKLVDSGRIGLDDPIRQFASDVTGAGRITVRDLLTERSGLPDINELPDYNEVLQQHQTPTSLVARINGRALLFEPGSKFLHEEHSAYNLLALIVEKKTGLPFADAAHRLVFQPLSLNATFIDDDTSRPGRAVAKSYQPLGVRELEPAPRILWSAKTGNGSAVTTAEDEARWIRALFRGNALKPATRNVVLGVSPRIGYGWFRGQSKRFNRIAYYMNGRAPGFASFVLYIPREELTVIAFSNIYSSATTDIGNDIASIALGLPFTPFHPGNQPLSPDIMANSTGHFQFGPDFYQKNARLALIAKGSELFLRWPSGEGVSPLIPIGPDEFVDRAYWERVKIERDSSGHVSRLAYDNFYGAPVNEN